MPRDRALEVLRALHDEPSLSFNFLSDLTAVDWLERESALRRRLPFALADARSSAAREDWRRCGRFHGSAVWR